MALCLFVLVDSLAHCEQFSGEITRLQFRNSLRIDLHTAVYEVDYGKELAFSALRLHCSPIFRLAMMGKDQVLWEYDYIVFLDFIGKYRNLPNN